MAGEPQEDVAGANLGDLPDIWADQNCVVHLVSGEMPEGQSQAERDRVHKRVRRFRYADGVMHRVFGNGSRRGGPRRAKREGIARSRMTRLAILASGAQHPLWPPSTGGMA